MVRELGRKPVFLPFLAGTTVEFSVCLFVLLFKNIFLKNTMRAEGGTFSI